MGDRVTTPDGTGRVVGLNLLERRVRVELDELERLIEYDLSEVEQQTKQPN